VVVWFVASFVLRVLAVALKNKKDVPSGETGFAAHYR
jgi:hypothetical protein